MKSGTRGKGLKPASERLSAARAVAVRLGKEIAFFQEGRRLALLIDDDETAARADEQLGKLRLAAQRAADKITLLATAAAEEERGQQWPENLETAEARLTELQAQHDALSRKRQIDRSASDQSNLDSLVCLIPALKAHIELLTRMAA